MKNLTMQVVMLLTLTFIIFSNATAQEHGSDHDEHKNWMLILGGGGMYQPAFTGASLYEWEPFPLLFGFYKWDQFSLFIEGEELGIEYTLTRDEMFSANAGIALGESRKESDASYLDGSGDFENPVQSFVGLSYGPNWLSGNVSLSYAPFFKRGENYNGYLTDISLESENVLIPFVIIGEAGLTLMDAVWADHYYGQNAGVEKVYAKADVLLYFCEFAGIYVNGSVDYLLGEAAKSQYIEEVLGLGTALGAFYMF